MDRFGCFIYLFKQKTAYELRISDWSSDGCSSDLRGAAPGTAARRAGWTGASASVPDTPRPPATRPSAGRAGRVRAAGPSRARPRWLDPKGVVWGKRVVVPVDRGGSRINQKKKCIARETKVTSQNTTLLKTH